MLRSRAWNEVVGDPWPWLWRCALAAVVLWCGAYAVWDAHDRAVWRERGVRVSALVTAEDCDGEGSSLRVDVAGTERAVLPCQSPGPRVGTRVAVVYDSANPSDVRLARQFDRTPGRTAALVGGGTLAALALLEGYWWQERRTRRTGPGSSGLSADRPASPPSRRPAPPTR